MKYKGLTLIETMIMIWVFSIGILTVLNLLSGSLYSLDNVKLRTQATFLAKEWIDLVYNMRDSNLEKELPWDCVVKDTVYTNNLENVNNSSNPFDGWARAYETNTDLNNFCESFFSNISEDGKILQVGFSNTNEYVMTEIKDMKSSFEENFDENELFLYSRSDGLEKLTWYSYDEKGEETFFARYISFEAVEGNWTDLDTTKILKINSNVLWKKWGTTWEMILESFIGNY